MGNKIKITEIQLNKLRKSLTEQTEETSIEEMGGKFHFDDEGKFNPGLGPVPEPYEMAEIVSSKIELHPEYNKDEDLYRRFVDALYDILVTKANTGEAFYMSRKKGLGKIDQDQLNESVEKLKSEFKRYK